MNKELTIREKSTLLTIISSFVPSIVIMILGAIKTRYIIEFLGSDNNGIYQLMLHLSSFVVFGNLGLGTIFKISYYKSISSNDKKKTTEIYNYSKIFFRKITIVMIALSIAISIFSMFFVDAQLTRIQILILQFLVCVPNIISFYVGKDLTLLSARQKEYIFLFISNSIYILRLIISLFIIYFNHNLFLFLSIDMIIALFEYIFIELVIKKDNQNELNDSNEIDKTPLSLSKYLIPNKISSIVFLNIDAILISKMISNTFVSIYTTYIYITNCLVSLEGYIINSLMNSLGNLYHSDDTYKNIVTQEVILISTCIFIVACVPLSVGMGSFVAKIWIGKEEYILDSITYILICIYFALYSVRTLSCLFEDSTGSYKETYSINIIQAIGNAVLSVILCKFIGIKGIILATIIILAPFEAIKMKRSMEHIKIEINNKYIYMFILLSFAEILISVYIVRYIVINTFIEWIICMIITSLVSFLVNGSVYLLIYKEFKTILIKLRKKLSK